MTDCIFCKLVSGEIPCEKVYEDEHTFAFLDIKPLCDGHLLVLPKTHAIDALSISKEDYLHVMATVHKLAPVLRDVFGAEGINIISNNGAAAGQVVFHSHTHIIPRFQGDGYVHWQRTTNGVRPLKESQERIVAALNGE